MMKRLDSTVPFAAFASGLKKPLLFHQLLHACSTCSGLYAAAMSPDKSFFWPSGVGTKGTSSTGAFSFFSLGSLAFGAGQLFFSFVGFPSPATFIAGAAPEAPFLRSCKAHANSSKLNAMILLPNAEQPCLRTNDKIAKTYAPFGV